MQSIYLLLSSNSFGIYIRRIAFLETQSSPPEDLLHETLVLDADVVLVRLHSRPPINFRGIHVHEEARALGIEASERQIVARLANLHEAHDSGAVAKRAVAHHAGAAAVVGACLRSRQSWVIELLRVPVNLLAFWYLL